MRNRVSGLRRTVAVGAVLAGALGTGLSGTAAAAQDTAAVACPIGYVCLQPLLGSQPVLVRQGESARFSPALRVTEVTNSTSVRYCVTGDFSYGLPPGGTQTWDSSVIGLAPMPPGGACLL
ncbi:hypothetical protein Sipo8835_43115 [Streptomyces ipomoeae]|uniref:Uncharacterized protein n=1 Tax=Streptomyces ipomoeae TaxID=103232 RepID=A0A540P005_9ACTN|nr:hypothetical protein [Streptomyces ipomoeae]MDX2824024.1 hypothetical protein [Streptomyces ipomoeae]MDX2843097.1 hypothetical protein [Streptomyces ipomoeae]MDX2931890.1 hypothetical protein [Streptomyces ipomoeae]TQE16648.1 hypothetical protein Sipo8835_43115 [Streptomyces ipomoeae]TQE24094.1 hypothetical protein Sipo7851_36465 [Streptomyces ipomoeae]